MRRQRLARNAAAAYQETTRAPLRRRRRRCTFHSSSPPLLRPLTSLLGGRENWRKKRPFVGRHHAIRRPPIRHRSGVGDRRKEHARLRQDVDTPPRDLLSMRLIPPFQKKTMASVLPGVPYTRSHCSIPRSFFQIPYFFELNLVCLPHNLR